MMQTPVGTASSPSLLHTTALLGAAAGLSRVLGLLRDMVMAWLLGGGLAADALVAAMRLPHVLRRLLGEGSLSMTLTAVFVRTTQTRDGDGAGKNPGENAAALPRLAGLARAVGWRLALLLGLAVAAGMIWAEGLTALLTPGQNDAALRAEAAPLLRICLPYAFFAVMAALNMALLHSLRVFLPSALSPVLFNVTVIGCALLAWAGLGAAPTLLAWGVCCGGLGQWLWQAAAARRLGVWRAVVPPPPGAVGDCLRRLPHGVLGAGAPQLAMLCAMAAASCLPHGALAALYYAERLLEAPLGLAGAALGMAGLPTLAALAAAGRREELAREIAAALRLSLLATLPAAAGLLAVARPLVETLFGRGAFDADAVVLTALALCGYVPALPAYGLTRPLLAACNAVGRMDLIRISGLAAVAVSLLVPVLALPLLPPSLAILGPALGVVLGLWTQTLLLWHGLRIPGCGLPWSFLWRLGLAALLTGLAAHAVVRAVDGLWSLPLGVAAGLAVYPLALLALGGKRAFWAKKPPAGGFSSVGSGEV